ncbi:hypothetical protein BJ741DRAFT_646435 [Chytriomyces cf. hyalinus JEL632]|nr:hypothetical protein BJ741DRAFT_646435 [Chytriomyces cf. hyalinus JEL632]
MQNAHEITHPNQSHDFSLERLFPRLIERVNLTLLRMILNAALAFLIAALTAPALAAVASNTGSKLVAVERSTIVQFGNTAFQCNSKNVQVTPDLQKFVFPSNITTRSCGLDTVLREKPFLNLTTICPSARTLANFKNFHLFDPAKVCQKCRVFNPATRKCTPAISTTLKSAMKAKQQLLKRQTEGAFKRGCDLMDDGSYLCDYNEVDLWFLEKSPVSVNDFYFVANDEKDTQAGQWEFYFFDAASYKRITNATTLAGVKQSRDCWCGNTIRDAPGDPLTPATQCGFKFPCFTDLGCDLYCKPDYDGKTAMMVNFRRQTRDFKALPGEDSYYWYWAEAKDDDLQAYDPKEFEKDANVTATAAVKSTGAAQTSKSSAFIPVASVAALLLSFFSV